jgi:kumamolisin
LNAYNVVFQSAVKKGITICVASGDNGYKDNGKSISVDFPASSPNVVSVGGTSLYSNNGIYINENAWNGSGGGYSKIFKKPNYQNVNNKILLNSNFRCVPDICSNADPNTGYIIYINNNFYIIGGTSSSAPMIAGSLGRLNYNKFLNNSLYNYIGSKFFHDIISGTNGYNSIIGFDLVTGLGSLNFANIPNGL